MPEPASALLQAILDQVRAHQYLTLFFVIAIEEAGVPLPAPGDLIIAYYGWRTHGDPSEVAQVILTCALASTAGTLVPFAIARRFGMAVARRLSRWLDVAPSRVDELAEGFRRHTLMNVFIARLVPGLRVAVSLVAGTTRVPVARFSPAIFAAATIYWTGWVLVGVVVGPRVEDVVSPAYLRVIVIAIPVVVIGTLVGRILWARRSHRS